MNMKREQIDLVCSFMENRDVIGVLPIVFGVSDCSPSNRERQLGLDRRETVTLLMKRCCNSNSTQYERNR